MADIEKAINDLEEIKGKLIPAIARMYGSGFSSVFACEKVEEKIDNALELLKEQQPRVLEYEELFKEETFSLWYEDKEHLLLLHVACVDGEYEDMHVNVAVEDSYENWSTYGKTWRMWNAIPTEEQRKAEPWKDGEHG